MKKSEVAKLIRLLKLSNECARIARAYGYKPMSPRFLKRLAKELAKTTI
jgi:hypothetical protein